MTWKFKISKASKLISLFAVAAMTANGTTANGGQEGEKVAPPPEKGSWTIGLINSR